MAPTEGEKMDSNTVWAHKQQPEGNRVPLNRICHLVENFLTSPSCLFLIGLQSFWKWLTGDYFKVGHFIQLKHKCEFQRAEGNTLTGQRNEADYLGFPCPADILRAMRLDMFVLHNSVVFVSETIAINQTCCHRGSANPPWEIKHRDITTLWDHIQT